MSAWRRTALEMLPRLKATVETAGNPMALWIELHRILEEAYVPERPDDDLIGRIYHYAEWCWESKNADAGQAVACAFYEHLPISEAVARDLPRWMTTARFGELEGVFRYFLSAEEYEAFRVGFVDARAALARAALRGRTRT